jgi:hypothetical protein
MPSSPRPGASGSFAASAELVNDILSASPENAMDRGPQSQPPDGGPPDPEVVPGAPTELPITPDFFTSSPRKRSRLHR